MRGLLRVLGILTGTNVVFGRIFGPPATPQTPAPPVEGEATAGAGQTPEGGETAPSPDAEVLSSGKTTEAATPPPALRPPGSPLPCEFQLWWQAHPSRREEFTDEHLAHLIDTWAKETSR